MQKESSQNTHPHHPFEHVQVPAHPLSSHHHHVRREDGTETRDFERPHILDGLTNVLSGWGWLTPESEGRSHSRKSLSGQGSLDPQGTALHSLESDQIQGTTGTNDKAEEALQTSFAEDYGKFNRVLQYDDSSTVQLYEKKVPGFDQTTSPARPSQSHMLARLRRASTSNTIRELYAVKVFRHTQNTSFPLASTLPHGSQTESLCHPNIVPIIDILYNKQKNLCLVMPYCAGGSLHYFLSQRGRPRENLSTEEVNCFAIQILRAVAFLHEHDIAHGDIRPEHVLLTAQGAIKVGGFGEDEDAIRELAQLSHGSNLTSSVSVPSPNSAPASNYKPKLCIRRRVSDLSVPYLPPERFPSRRGSRRQIYTHQDVFDIRAGDIWACGIVYMVLRSGQLLWHSAHRVNPEKSFADYLSCRLEEDGYSPIQVLENRCRNVVYAMLHPDSGSRITAAEVLRSEWALGVAVCEVGERGL
ncbi:kinase-like domain-containing protein [Penicillium canescens]|nr:kinase-like domain-containing protein [Penicillium canescens]